MGPLQFLEPLVALCGALSAGLAAIISFALVATVVMPGVVVLLAFTPGTGVWRWPVVWWIPSVVGVLLLSRVIPKSVETTSAFWWVALGTYAAWAMFAAVCGTLVLLVRAARFVFQPAERIAPLRLLGRLLFGWGAAFCAALISLCAVIGTAPELGWQLLWAFSIGLASFVLLRRRDDVSTAVAPHVTARLSWLVGSTMVALLAPVVLVFAFALIDMGPWTNDGGLSRGVPVALLAVLLCAGGVWMIRRGLRAPTTP